jgi:hypothetical protein
MPFRLRFDAGTGLGRQAEVLDTRNARQTDPIAALILSVTFWGVPMSGSGIE